jgi:hypothetical protein
MSANEAVAIGVAATPAPLPGRNRAFVVDPRLALSPLGLVAAARLASECAVWMPRELRETLKSPQAFSANPDKLAPRVYGAHLRKLTPRDEEIRDALGQWSAVLHGPIGATRFYYLGEHAGESLLPAAVDGGLQDRFERLASGLDLAMRRAGYDLPRGETIASCFRDAVALCGALAPYGAVLLSVLEADRRGTPALCNYLDAWGVGVTDVTARAGADADVLRALLAGAGLGPIEWSGVALAAIHIVPPGFGLDLADEAAALALWQRTNVFWHRL